VTIFGEKSLNILPFEASVEWELVTGTICHQDITRILNKAQSYDNKGLALSHLRQSHSPMPVNI
jgi:hypothetical protein